MINSPKNVLISGASSGIGRELALVYAKSDVNLFLCGRSQKKLNEVKKLCENRGAKVSVKIFDVSDEKSAADFIEEIEILHEIDLVIANAGIRGGEATSAENFAKIKEIFSTNVSGVINVIHPAIEKMKLRKKGQVAIISSLAGFCGIPSSPAYSASKAAVRVYAEGLRGNLLQHGINVSAICPGYVLTPMTQQNKFRMPFIMSVEKTAQIIKKGLEKNKSRIAFPFPLYLAVLFVSLLPRSAVDFVVNFIFSRIARKP